MSRSLNPELDAHLDNKALTAIWLVELALPGIPATYRYCSHVDVTSFSGYSWTQGAMTVSGPSVRAGAGMQASVTLIQNSSVVSSFLSGSWENATAKLYLTYYEGTTLPTPQLLLSGDVIDANLSGKNVTFTITAAGRRTNITPWIRIAPPVFNRLTSRGTVLTWGIDKIVIDRR